MDNNEYLTLIHAQAKVIKLKAAGKLKVLYEDHAPTVPRPDSNHWIVLLKSAVIVERDSNGDTFERIDTKQIFADVLYQKFERIKHNALERQIFMLFCYIALFEHYIENEKIDQALGSISIANQAFGAFCGIDISGTIFSHENSSKRDYSESRKVEQDMKDFYRLHLKAQVDSGEILQKTAIGKIQEYEGWNKSDRVIGGYIREVNQEDSKN